jgi:hypothetical protein
MVWLRVKTGPQCTSEIELALAKPVGVSNFFCLLDVVALSHGLHAVGLAMTHIGECTARVVAFDNLSDDSSPDARRVFSPKNVGEDRASTVSSVSG